MCGEEEDGGGKGARGEVGESVRVGGEWEGVCVSGCACACACACACVRAWEGEERGRGGGKGERVGGCG